MSLKSYTLIGTSEPATQEDGGQAAISEFSPERSWLHFEGTVDQDLILESDGFFLRLQSWKDFSDQDRNDTKYRKMSLDEHPMLKLLAGKKLKIEITVLGD